MNIRVHSLRHRCATAGIHRWLDEKKDLRMHLYQHGMDLTLISQWLGHAQFETTLIYAYADTEHKRKAIEQATPANSILKNKKSVKRFVVTDDEMIRRLYGLS